MYIFFFGGSVSKESTGNAGDPGSIPGLGRSPRDGMTTHASILTWKDLMDRGAWWATVNRVAKNWT